MPRVSDLRRRRREVGGRAAAGGPQRCGRAPDARAATTPARSAARTRRAARWRERQRPPRDRRRARRSGRSSARTCRTRAGPRDNRRRPGSSGRRDALSRTPRGRGRCSSTARRAPPRRKCAADKCRTRGKRGVRPAWRERSAAEHTPHPQVTDRYVGPHRAGRSDRTMRRRGARRATIAARPGIALAPQGVPPRAPASPPQSHPCAGHRPRPRHADSWTRRRRVPLTRSRACDGVRPCLRTITSTTTRVPPQAA